jgi:hypothetical protein
MIHRISKLLKFSDWLNDCQSDSIIQTNHSLLQIANAKGYQDIVQYLELTMIKQRTEDQAWLSSCFQTMIMLPRKRKHGDDDPIEDPLKP